MVVPGTLPLEVVTIPGLNLLEPGLPRCASYAGQRCGGFLGRFQDLGTLAKAMDKRSAALVVLPWHLGDLKGKWILMWSQQSEVIWHVMACGVFFFSSFSNFWDFITCDMYFLASCVPINSSWISANGLPGCWTWKMRRCQWLRETGDAKVLTLMEHVFIQDIVTYVYSILQYTIIQYELDKTCFSMSTLLNSCSGIIFVNLHVRFVYSIVLEFLDEFIIHPLHHLYFSSRYREPEPSCIVSQSRCSFNSC